MPLDTATADRLADLLAQGATNRAAARELGIDKNTAARYRALLGVGPAPKRPAPNRSTLTAEQKVMTFMRPADGGHMEWTGRRTRSTGTPVFTHHERTYTARSIAFRAHTGRAPEGYVTAECDQPDWCVAPAHLEDEPGRTRARAALAAITGRATPLVECNRGHATAEHRRYLPDGTPYCGACHAEAKAARRAAA
ncbi:MULTISPECIES: hypothetical protein [Streptomyces rochei group]|uniref:hypothetical protein n=1 Tax=Streptomyces rochei group TaxID=2867164 RepID=UPI001873C1C2|nr:hypothetical protein [Streptomyces vinaceusdrappus]GHC44279.1 hypothetical protein GCM10010308_74390 [Streptomyces vinaceusdrappus]